MSDDDNVLPGSEATEKEDIMSDPDSILGPEPEEEPHVEDLSEFGGAFPDIESDPEKAGEEPEEVDGDDYDDKDPI